MTKGEFITSVLLEASVLALEANAISNPTEFAKIAIGAAWERLSKEPKSENYPPILDYEKTDRGILRYEIEIGIAALKEEQRTLYRESGGKKGKYWLACSPKWATDDMKSKVSTKYEIMYWVNYGDDETYGWFTVEQIKEWLTTPERRLHELGGTKERAKGSILTKR